MIKLIMFDIDGTLRDERMGVVLSTQKAIQECKQQNVKVGVCTGRTMSMIQDDILELNFDIIVSGDGSQIVVEDHTIQDLYFHQPTLIKILDSLPIQDIGLSIETKDKIYMNDKACHILKQQNKKKGILSLENEKITYQNTIASFDKETMPVSKICIWSKNKLEKQDVQYIQCIEGETCYYELIHKDAGKGQAIKRVSDYLKIDKDEIMCFGDGFNDIGMFEACGHSVAMKNSVAELIRIADEICDEGINDGIYKTLKQMNIVKGEL